MAAKRKASSAAKKAYRKGVSKAPRGMLILGSAAEKKKRATYAETRKVGKAMEKARSKGHSPVSVTKKVTTGGWPRGSQTTIRDKKSGEVLWSERPHRTPAKRTPKKKR